MNAISSPTAPVGAGALADIAVVTIDGESKSLREFLGKATLIVNVASRCGFTPQYSGLAALSRDFGEKGLRVLGFPCDQFGHQEPGTEAQIKHFCAFTYNVDFPLFAKVDVNGPQAHALFRYLKAAAPGFLGLKPVKWNFTKFLVTGEGLAVRRFAPSTKPAALRQDIARILA